MGNACRQSAKNSYNANSDLVIQLTFEPTIAIQTPNKQSPLCPISKCKNSLTDDIEILQIENDFFIYKSTDILEDIKKSVSSPQTIKQHNYGKRIFRKKISDEFSRKSMFCNSPSLNRCDRNINSSSRLTYSPESRKGILKKTLDDFRTLSINKKQNSTIYSGSLFSSKKMVRFSPYVKCQKKVLLK